MRWQVAIGAMLAVVASAEFGHAADPRYPDWPCTQAKVPEISLAAVWAGPPLDDVADKWRNDAKASALVAKLAARRFPLKKPRRRSRNFWQLPRAEKAATGKLLFAGLFDTLNAQRSSVMNGLERVTRKQRDAADKIRAATHRTAGIAGSLAARSAQDRGTRQSAGLANPDF